MSKETEREVFQARRDYTLAVAAHGRRKTKANQDAVDRALVRLGEAEEQLAAERAEES